MDFGINFDSLLSHFDKLVEALPSGVDPELKADLNVLMQTFKKDATDNKDAQLEGKDLIHSAESYKSKCDYLVSEFNRKHGIKDNK